MSARVAIIADDLTGAADTGVAFLAAAMPVAVRWLDTDAAAMLGASDGAVAFDTRSRGGDELVAQAATRDAMAACSRAGVEWLYKKIDSILRGHVGVEVAAALASARPDTVAIVAPAFPAIGRTTIDGRVVVDGQARPGPAVADLFSAVGLTVRQTGSAGVAGDQLSVLLGESGTQRPQVVVCDARTDADLAAVVDAGRRAVRPVLWVGSGGLARALAAVCGNAGRRDVPPRPVVRGPIVAVVGSRAAIAREQAEALVGSGFARVRWQSSRADRSRDAVAAALADARHVLVTLDETALDGEGNFELVAGIGRTLAPLAATIGGLILTGGDTATGVIRAWGGIGLDLIEEIAPGVVLSTAAGLHGLPVVTKAGSFGGSDTLAGAAAALESMSVL